MGTEAVLTNTHNLCFEQKYEKYQNFYLKIFIFLVVKFSIYLNRYVFVMIYLKTAGRGQRKLIRVCGRLTGVCTICLCMPVRLLNVNTILEACW